MAFNPCTPCACPPGTMDDYSFHQAAIVVLCSILTELQVETGEEVDLVSVGGVAITLGQKAMAASIPVTLASNQTWTGATNLGKAEDAASVSGDTGVAQLIKRTDTAAAQTDTTGDYTVPTANSFGAQYTNIDFTFQRDTANGLLKREDDAHTSLDAGVFALSIRNEGGATFAGTELDYCAIASNRVGVVYVEHDPSKFFGGSANAMMRAEDSDSANGYYGWSVMSVREDTPTVSTSASLDYTPVKSNDVGATYVEPSNKVGTYAANTVAGAAGGVPTTGAAVLTNSSKKILISIFSTLDVAVQISLDAGSTYPFAIPATNGSLVIDLGSNGRWSASNIFAKAIGSNSSSGTIYAGAVI